MEFEECRELLAGMVASVLPEGSRILRTSVTQIMTDAESKLTFFLEFDMKEDIIMSSE